MEILSKSEWKHAAVLACMCHSFPEVCIGGNLQPDWCPAQRNLLLRSLDSNPDCNCAICWVRTWQAKWEGICYPSRNLAAFGDHHFSIPLNRDCNNFLIFLWHPMTCSLIDLIEMKAIADLGTKIARFDHVPFCWWRAGIHWRNEQKWLRINLNKHVASEQQENPWLRSNMLLPEVILIRPASKRSAVS